MTSATPPLIARLRRRMAAMTWLLALLVLTKASFATVCLTDGMSASPATLSTSADAGDTCSASPLDGDGDRCWHAGAGGCHCSCVHVSAIVPGDWIVAGALAISVPVAATSPSILVALRDDHLRPPIA